MLQSGGRGMEIGRGDAGHGQDAHAASAVGWSPTEQGAQDRGFVFSSEHIRGQSINPHNKSINKTYVTGGSTSSGERQASASTGTLEFFTVTDSVESDSDTPIEMPVRGTEKKGGGSAGESLNHVMMKINQSNYN